MEAAGLRQHELKGRLTKGDIQNHVSWPQDKASACKEQQVSSALPLESNSIGQHCNKTKPGDCHRPDSSLTEIIMHLQPAPKGCNLQEGGAAQLLEQHTRTAAAYSPCSCRTAALSLCPYSPARNC